jgi:hypothetical protein
MLTFSGALARIKKQYVKLVSQPKLLAICFSSFFWSNLMAWPGPLYGERTFLLYLFTFLCGKKQWKDCIRNFILSPLHLWTKAKECLMYSTRKPIFNIYYRLQLFLKNYDIQPYYDFFYEEKQVGADIKNICKYSVENLRFVLKHEIFKFLENDEDLEKIGFLIFYHNNTMFSDSLALNGESTLLLLQELEANLVKRSFERIVFGLLLRTLSDIPRLELFYLICDAYGDKYNVYEGSHGVLITSCINFGSFDLFTYLLTKSKQMNLDAKCETHLAINYDAPYALALNYKYTTQRKMLFSHGATPSISFDIDYDQDYYFECKEIQEDLLHGLLYCFHCKNVFALL